MEREWSRLPKKEELEQHLRELTRQTEELRDEVTQVGVVLYTTSGHSEAEG